MSAFIKNIFQAATAMLTWRPWGMKVLQNFQYTALIFLQTLILGNCFEKKQLIVFISILIDKIRKLLIQNVVDRYPVPVPVGTMLVSSLLWMTAQLEQPIRNLHVTICVFSRILNPPIGVRGNCLVNLPEIILIMPRWEPSTPPPGA